MTRSATAAFTLGRAQWPAIHSLTIEVFQAFVDDAAIELESLEQHAGDVYLAAATASGDQEAIKTFESTFLSELPRWLSRLRLPPDTFDDVGQVLRAKLLVGPPPKLAQYRANGPLGAWIRVAAVRTALDLSQTDPLAAAARGPAGDPLLHALDPEQQLVRHKYGAMFETALREAVAQLSKRDRNLLRFHYLSGMSFEAIARSYRVHRATAVRWLAAIRDELETAVRIQLWQDLGLSPTEFRSLWNAVRSGVEISLSQLLAPG